MKKRTKLLFVCLLPLLFSCRTSVSTVQDILKLHPENPNYFLYKGNPTILLTSGEHYGAVMNTGYNYEKYLSTLKKEGFNYTRIFIGPYSEAGGNNFGITNNTMSPEFEKWLTPWEKEPISNKYDLSNWNNAFFNRLKSFISRASVNEIVVEVTLFTSYYTGHQWSTSPFNPKNNIQGFDSISFKQVNTINNGALMDIQEKYVRKVVRELNNFGNLFFEIQNEPWSDNPHFQETIVETDGGALYNNLDYSFTVGSEDGTYAIDKKTPGWGGAIFRQQLKIIMNFIAEFDFIKMKPDNSVLKVFKGNLADYQVLAEVGRQYAIYLENGNSLELTLQIPDGKYTAEWINTKTGNIEGSEILSATNGLTTIVCPDFQEDIGLKIKRENN